MFLHRFKHFHYISLKAACYCLLTFTMKDATEKFKNHQPYFSLFRIARVGIFPRSSLLGAGQVGFGEFGKGGSIG
jgi:hypothetical protein